VRVLTFNISATSPSFSMAGGSCIVSVFEFISSRYLSLSDSRAFPSTNGKPGPIPRLLPILFRLAD
jgi:hypothetical protein